MRYIFILFAIFPWFLQALEDPAFLNESDIAAIKSAAEAGDSNHQLMIGIIFELGYGLPQNIEQAAEWYRLSAQQGNVRAQKRLGVLLYEGTAVPQDKVLGMALVLQASFASDAYWKEFSVVRRRLEISLTKGEMEEAFHITRSWQVKKVAAKHKKMRTNPIFHLISDRPDPQDANERVYGPGTYDSNVGMLRSEYERMQRELEEFVSKLGDLKNQAELQKWDSIREKIEALEGEYGALRMEALKDLAQAILESAAAGSFILTCPPLAFLSGFLSVEAFKESAERYNESVDVQKEIQSLQGILEIERSLERSRELYGSGREK